MIFFGGMGRVTSNKWLDFGDYMHHDMEPAIFEAKLYYCRIGAVVQILLWTRESCRQIFINFFEGGVSLATIQLIVSNLIMIQIREFF